MAALSIPEGGLILRPGAEKSASAFTTPSQALSLDLPRETKDHILKSLRNGEQVRLRFGKKPILQLGRKSHELAVRPESLTSNLYTGGGYKDSGLYFSGKLSHRLEVQMAKEVLAKSDAALTALENTLKSIQEQKVSNETSFVRNKEEMKELNKKAANGRKPPPLPLPRKDRFLGGFTKSTPSSPFLGSSSSPLGPTSLSSSLAAKQDLVRLEAIKIPMIHLLAATPSTTDAIVQKLRVSRGDADKIIQKFARDGRDAPSKKELKEKSYRDLDVWKFPYSTQEERQAAIDRAIQAFDRMRIDRKDPAWQLLLPEAERGKGKILSKLNFDKPVINHASPRPQSQHRSPKHDATDNNGRGRLDAKDVQAASRSQSHDPPQRKKAAQKEAQLKREVSKLGKKSPNTAKANGKFKSAETIEDSDEEMEVAKAALDKPSASEIKGHSPKPPPSPMPHQSFHKSKLSTSSFPDESTSVLKPTPRPRTASSPLKPSTSDSSPPTGSTDLDSSSTKASSHSSATSSPPSSNEMPKRKNFSPVVTGTKNTPARGRSQTETSASGNSERKDAIARGRTDVRNAVPRGRSPVKRKPESDLANESTPAKRQLLNGSVNRSTRDSSNSIQAIGIANKKEKEPLRPAVDRKASESESISSPEKTEIATAEMVENTRRFKKYYEKYKRLHEKVASSSNADDQEVADLWKMHNRLAEMKKEIWDEFESLGKPPKIVLNA